MFYYVSYIITKKDQPGQVTSGCNFIDCHPLTWRTKQKESLKVKTCNIVFWQEITKEIYDEGLEHG